MAKQTAQPCLLVRINEGAELSLTLGCKDQIHSLLVFVGILVGYVNSLAPNNSRRHEPRPRAAQLKQSNCPAQTAQLKLPSRPRYLPGSGCNACWPASRDRRGLENESAMEPSLEDMDGSSGRKGAEGSSRLDRSPTTVTNSPLSHSLISHPPSTTHNLNLI